MVTAHSVGRLSVWHPSLPWPYCRFPLRRLIGGGNENSIGNQNQSQKQCGLRSQLWIEANVRDWLKADLQPPEIEVRFAPNTGHSEAHAGLPLVTRSGHKLSWLAEQADKPNTEPTETLAAGHQADHGRLLGGKRDRQRRREYSPYKKLHRHTLALVVRAIA